MTESRAIGQRSLVDASVIRPLRPPLTLGYSETGTDDQPVPTEVTYDYDAIDPESFGSSVVPGLER